MEFRNLVKYIVEEMGIKGGPTAGKLASFYKKQVEAENSDLDSIEATKLAKQAFDRDSRDNRLKLLKRAEQEIANSRAQRKRSKSEMSE